MSLVARLRDRLLWEGPGQKIRFLHFKKVLPELTLQEDAHVLDAGAGRGAYSIYLRKKLASSKITALDSDDNELGFITKKIKDLDLKDIRVVKGSVTENNGKESFDLIVCVDVLEHVDDDSKAVRQFFQSLKKKGLIFIHVPAIKQKRYFEEFKNMPHQHDHVREGYTLEGVKTLLKTNGFRVKKSGYTFGNFGALSWEFGKKFLGSQGSIKGLVFLAVSSILAPLDTVVENKHGNGIFVLAVKPE